ncbi:L-rhamnose mutarotase [Flavivirga amylovorans]|uniref:L-rhamnose mutarotase n=1 Tax=Flavivirga amylovorans TaxID=870486 RepID=A0ABT8X4N1_9FLAO|nr:L-rhamnose mutarotase [Flavivirga amylovorans]MDO5988850.1 L-rhamnose mutarotase [Flavivirga amylovorans]
MDYSENQFRRFTFFLETDSKEIIWSFLKWDVATLRTAGILNLEGYRKENQCFFVVDTLPKMTHTDVRKVFEMTQGMFNSQENKTDKNQHLPIQTEPLERIYELDQEKVYAAQEGQLKTSLGTCKRFVWTLLLEEAPELMDEYRKAHSIGQAWPQITKNMKQVGVKDMEIYLHGNQAILIMDTNPDFDLEKVSPVWQSLPHEKEWQEYVAKFQRTRPESSIQEKWLDMEKI